MHRCEQHRGKLERLQSWLYCKWALIKVLWLSVPFGFLLCLVGPLWLLHSSLTIVMSGNRAFSDSSIVKLALNTKFTLPFFSLRLSSCQFDSMSEREYWETDKGMIHALIMGTQGLYTLHHSTRRLSFISLSLLIFSKISNEQCIFCFSF